MTLAVGMQVPSGLVKRKNGRYGGGGEGWTLPETEFFLGYSLIETEYRFFQRRRIILKAESLTVAHH